MRRGAAFSLMLLACACTGGDTLGDADESEIANNARAIEQKADADVERQIDDIKAADGATDE